MAELAIMLAFIFGGTIGFFIGRASAPRRPEGTLPPGGKPPQNRPLP